MLGTDRSLVFLFLFLTDGAILQETLRLKEAVPKVTGWGQWWPQAETEKGMGNGTRE